MCTEVQKGFWEISIWIFYEIWLYAQNGKNTKFCKIWRHSLWLASPSLGSLLSLASIQVSFPRVWSSYSIIRAAIGWNRVLVHLFALFTRKTYRNSNTTKERESVLFSAYFIPFQRWPPVQQLIFSRSLLHSLRSMFSFFVVRSR